MHPNLIRSCLAAACLLGTVAAHATDPATSPFAADRYDYSVLPAVKVVPKTPAAPAAPAALRCRDAKAACQPTH